MSKPSSEQERCVICGEVVTSPIYGPEGEPAHNRDCRPAGSVMTAAEQAAFDRGYAAALADQASASGGSEGVPPVWVEETKRTILLLDYAYTRLSKRAAHWVKAGRSVSAKQVYEMVNPLLRALTDRKGALTRLVAGSAEGTPNAKEDS